MFWAPVDPGPRGCLARGYNEFDQISLRTLIAGLHPLLGLVLDDRKQC